MSADIPPPNCSCAVCKGNQTITELYAREMREALQRPSLQQQAVEATVARRAAGCKATAPTHVPAVDILARCSRCTHFRWCHPGGGAPLPVPPLPTPTCPASPETVCEAFVPAMPKAPVSTRRCLHCQGSGAETWGEGWTGCYECWRKRGFPRTPAAAPTNNVPTTKAPLERLGEVEYAMGALAAQIAFGSSKQGRMVGDWRKLTRAQLIGKAIRHLLSAAAGQRLDTEGRSHLVAALADCAMAVELEGKP